MPNFNTGVPSLDPDELKKALKEFLQGQSEFNSYNFDGSALSTLIDLLTKNTHYLSYIANMMARESFLQRAQIRDNVVDHAQKLSYVPGSKTCPRAVIDIVVRPDSGTVEYPPFIVMNPGTVFAGQYSNEVVTFTNQDSYVLYLNPNDNTYVRSGVEVFQGDLIEEKFVYSGTGDSAAFTLSNSNIDISTLRVNVQNSESDTNSLAYTKAQSITEIGPTSNVYFLYEVHDGKYSIEFGDGVLGKALVNGNVINVLYMALNSDTIANGINSLTLVSDIDGFVDSDVTVSTVSFGGSDRESIDQIRKMAPIGWIAQDRSVTVDDYVVNLKKVFPQAKSAIGWGGEENDPPRYGAVFLAINTRDGSILVNEVKNEVQKLLKKNNIGPITPIIVDPQYVEMDLIVKVGFDSITSKLSMNDEFSEISKACIMFSKNYLEDFERHFISSELISLIKSRPAIISADVEINVSKTVELAVGHEALYTVKFDNPLEPFSIEAKGFKVYPTDVDARIYDDGFGVIKIDRLENGVRRVINTNAGSVDYQSGVVSFTLMPISVSDSNDRISIKATPSEENYLALRENIIRIRSVEVKENQRVRRG